MNNLRSYFPNYLSGSIFSKMVALGAPWDSDIGLDMDISYFQMYSGIKNPTEFVSLNSVDGTADDDVIARILWHFYGRNWEKLWNIMLLKYKPIHNYNMDEKVNRNQTDNRTIAKTGSLDSKVDATQNDDTKQDSKETYDSSVKETQDDSTTQDVTGKQTVQYGKKTDASETVKAYTYAFNSVNQTPTGVTETTGDEQQSGSDTTDTTKNTTGTLDSDKTSTQNDTTVLASTGSLDRKATSTRGDTTKEDTTDDDVLAEDITRSREGNTGQYSYQDLLRQEFELWKWNFFQHVFEDCDKFMVLSVYNPCYS